jgi:hypothetical protein
VDPLPQYSALGDATVGEGALIGEGGLIGTGRGEETGPPLDIEISAQFQNCSLSFDGIDTFVSTPY